MCILAHVLAGTEGEKLKSGYITKLRHRCMSLNIGGSELATSSLVESALMWLPNGTKGAGTLAVCAAVVSVSWFSCALSLCKLCHMNDVMFGKRSLPYDA